MVGFAFIFNSIDFIFLSSWYNIVRLSALKVLGWIIVCAVIVIAILAALYPEYFTEGYYATVEDDGYTCLAGIGVPLKIMPDGNVACMSLNGIDCLWTADDCRTQLEKYRLGKKEDYDPLVCGTDHVAKWHGTTGYDYKDADGKSGGHWCQKGQAAETAGNFGWWSRVKQRVASVPLTAQ